jgi:predicted O-methyltransferase YrrM
MSEKTWSSVDEYLDRTLNLTDSALSSALKANAAGGLPAIDVSPAQGRLLQLFARAVGARRILEIGGLGGYSTIWLARALPEGGRIVSLELSPKHAEVARANLKNAGLADVAEVRVGAALDSLAVLTREGGAPFDFVFIDADKPNSPAYLKAALDLCRPGAMIVVDNVVRDGDLADMKSRDPSILGARAVFEAIAAEPRLLGVGVQTVGAKGYDGFALALVVGTAA